MNFSLKNIGIITALLSVLICLSFFSVQRIKEINEKQDILFRLAKELNDRSKENWCDQLVAARRLALSRILDKYGSDIKKLWQSRKQGGLSEKDLIRMGPIYLRKSAPENQKYEIENSSWSWEEANNILIRINTGVDKNENRDKWRDFDTMVRFLLEKDILRVIKRKQFYNIEKKVHAFRIEKTINRKSAYEFIVPLNAGEFKNDKDKLKKIIEDAWSTIGKKVTIEWSEKPDVYTVYSNLISSRSFVNHKKRAMVIANLASIKTVVHEFGHILGFDDHYYTSWNNKNCYYMQESRLEDVMSSSEKGSVTSVHWKLLDKAYPWKNSRGFTNEFPYQYRNF